MNKLQASYSNDANKIIEQATQEKSVIKNKFFIDLAMETTDTKPAPEDPRISTKLVIMPM